MKKVRKSQAAIVALNWVKQFFPKSIVKVEYFKNLQFVLRF